ncbi:unnamed protein product [Enterobius vermicularis]|uniref:ER membrane protein complex subunit 1 n=1 Tax=Enterobius vermicularis TaxID=51028 RepID=A0A158Q990_ENTVE|nr:unnamed protein product [Enterobius vermicularis]
MSCQQEVDDEKILWFSERRYQHIGCPVQIEYRRSESFQSNLIYISSEADVIAAIKPTTGDIGRIIVSSARDGEVVRAWEREKGSFCWETELLNSDRVVTLGSSDDAVIVLGTLSVYLLTSSNGHIKWSSALDRTKKWIDVVVTRHHGFVIGVSSGELTIKKLDLIKGTLEDKSVIVAPWYNSNFCSFIHKVLVCFGTNSFYVLDPTLNQVAPKEVALSGITAISPSKVEGFVVLNTISKTYIYNILSSAPELLLTLEKADNVAVVEAENNRRYVASFSNQNGKGKVTITEAHEKNVVFSGVLKDYAGRAIKDLTLAVAGREFELITVGDDCKVDLYVSAYNELISEWSRHEALSTITSVEMVELPLSEAQAGIESEFTSDGGNIFESFARRLLSQLSQFRRAFLSASKEILSSKSFLNFRSKSFADWFSSLRLNEVGGSERASDAPLERDYFNLRKIIVAATRKSAGWTAQTVLLYLGKNMAPLRSTLGVLSVPLFIQRTTAHFQYSPQAAVAFADKLTSNGVIITFNPVTGSFIGKVTLSAPIKRIELLPFVNADNLHPLLVIDDSDKVTIIPRYAPLGPVPLPTHILTYNNKGYLRGFKLDAANLKLVPQWKSTLALSQSQKVIAVVGKPPSQRVHSSGRVLGDRSVLYKYSNPNLVAVAVSDLGHSSLHIHLVDAVTGYVVFSAKQNKVSDPFFFVHCENWLTYSYWNEKARRTEIAVIELYEGLTQTSELAFSSLTPVVPPVVNAVSQAYIFPQGISAMGVTDTEQGLSTRSILIAMPFGGLYGISKRMLDARRPLEMTPEYAEEMLIPYRPEIPIVSEDFINYNQTVLNVRAIKTAPSGLESTSLIFAYGLDLFFSRMTPSGTFDILKDDFDHKLISLVLLGLVVGSFICKKIGRSHTLKQSWQSKKCLLDRRDSSVLLPESK